MKRMNRIAFVLLGGGLLSLAGCGLTKAPDSIDSVISDVARISTDTTLTAQERRIQLRELGLSETTINGLLAGERTGNQFGGDLRSAYTKVHGDEYNTLTPDEVQIFGDAARTSGGPNFTLTDAQAQAIADLFADQGLASANNVSAFIGDSNNEIPQAIPNGVLQQLFVDFDEDGVLSQLP